MSYTQDQVQTMLEAIAEKVNETKGAVYNRVESIEAEHETLRAQLDAIEKAVALNTAGGVGIDRPGVSRGPFSNLGAFAQAVAGASRPGGQVDERLNKIRAAATGAGEAIPSDGGFLTQPDLAAPLLAAMFDKSMLASRCNRLPVSATSNGIRLPLLDEVSRATGSRWGGIQVYWASEAGTVTATRPKFRIAELSLHKLFGLCYVTDELLSDAPALGAVLQQAFSEELAFKLDDSILRGSGAGQPLGILNSPALVSVAAESGQAAGTILWENIVGMFARVPARARRNATWLVSQSIEPQLYSMSLTVGVGGVPVYMPSAGASGLPYASLFGRPVIPIEQASALGDLGDILLVDLGHYLLCDKGSIVQAMSVHLQFLYDEMTFRWTYRVDGQPMLRKAITPYKGANDLSPFVALAART